MLFLWMALSGWIATLLLALGIALPYIMRATHRCDMAGRARLNIHYCCGFLILAAALLHAWIPMSAGRMRAHNQNGLWLATIALFAILWQVTQGVALRNARGTERTSARRMHFQTMLCIVGLVLAHIGINRA